MKKIEIIVSEDGSNTLFLPDMNETYHSTHGAVQESEHVFIKMGINKAFENKTSLNVFEVGFGTGLNAILCIQYLSQNLDKTITYHSLEAFPLEEKITKELNYNKFLTFENSAEHFSKLHATEWGTQHSITPHFSLQKLHERLEDHVIKEGHYDIVFFDAFAPSRQAEMWEINQLEKCYSGLKKGGFLITYCANGQFKRNLKSIGFELEMLPGPPGKREMTRAYKR